MNSQYEIPIKFEHKATHPRDIIKKGDIKELFTFLVRRLYFSGRIDQYLTNIQMSNVVFYEPDSVYLKKIINEYGNYFERNGTKKRIQLEKVYEDHKYIWTGESIVNVEFSKEQIIKAIEDEIKESYKQSSKNAYPINNIKKIGERGKLKLYSAIVDLDSDDAVNFSEGITANFTDSSNHKQKVTILSYDLEKDIITFQLLEEINVKSGKLNSNSTSILYKLKERIEAAEKNDSPLWSILERKDKAIILSQPKKYFTDKLDDSQINALTCSLSNNYTYIWGPPGTGKTHLLSRLIYNLNEFGEKTVVCSIANVAVDGLLLMTMDLLRTQGYYEKSKFPESEKKFLRLGYTQSDKVRNLKEIQFESKILTQLSEELRHLEEEIIFFSEKKALSEADITIKANLISKKDEIKKEYDAYSKKFLSQANVIFMTSSKFIMEAAMEEIQIDNLIIDEGSMMSIPSLVALGNKVKKRIIIAGDFQQLGPIAISNSEHAKRWLHKDLFSLLGDKDQIINHPAVKMLISQRRSAFEITKLINSAFYNDKLKTIHRKDHDRVFKNPRLKQHVSFLNIPNTPNNQAEYSHSRSKYNKTSKMHIWSLIQDILEKEKREITIGIITPYRQQVKDYKYLLKKNGLENDFISVGTIHTFQGSEKDIIIWDIVDTPQNDMGLLYKGDTGERLVNVAISRAISRLIIVGYHRTFHESKGNDLVSNKIKTLISKAWDEYILTQ